jgi:hypothetical protein
MAFPGLYPPKVVKATQHPLEGRQHHGPGLRQEGMGYIQSKSPSESGKGSGDGLLPVYIPTGENILADSSSRFQEIPDWHLHPFVFRAIAARWGLPKINLFASNASKQTLRFYSWDASDNPEGVYALPLLYAFPPIALLKRVVKKLEMSKGTFILVSPLWEAQTWLASLLTLKVLEVRRLPFMEDLVTDLMMGKPPPIPSSSRLEDPCRINSLQDLPSNARDILKAGWRQSTED